MTLLGRRSGSSGTRSDSRFYVGHATRRQPRRVTADSAPRRTRPRSQAGLGRRRRSPRPAQVGRAALLRAAARRLGRRLRARPRRRAPRPCELVRSRAARWPSGVALLVALLGGYLVARALSRRVRRLETRRRATWPPGSFVEPLPVDSEDELGQLTRAFNEMQEQLRARGPRAARVHRERLARAAHADLLARRLRGAAPGRGARRGDARRVPRHDARAGRRGCRSSRSTCSTCRGSTPARSS